MTLEEMKGKVYERIELPELKFEQYDVLKQLETIISKTVKEDPSLHNKILFCGLSAFTPKPNHLMINENTSEGKSYPALEIAQYFPKENVVILSGATPQSFKYEKGILVDEDYNEIESILEGMEKELEIAKSDKKSNDVSKYEKEIRERRKNAKTLIDLRNKWIIFKEPPDRKLLEMLYSTLSSDEEFSEYKVTPDGSKGKRQTYTIVLRGTPAMLFCTTRDETTSKRWMETFSRFEIVSPKTSKKKYNAGMKLIGITDGLPKKIYEEVVINPKDKDEAKILVKNLIETIKENGGEIFNPFIDEISEQFPQEVGYRWRQYKRFNNYIKMRTLCYSDYRPKVIIENKEIPFVTVYDLKWVIEMMEDGEIVPPNKLAWYKDVFKKVFAAKRTEVNFGSDSKPLLREVIRGKDIVDYLQENKTGKATVKTIRDTYLNMLSEHGIIESAKDPENTSRNAYWIEDNSNGEKTSLIVTSSLNESGVRSCLGKYLKQRFEYSHKHKKISEDELVKIVTEGLGSEAKNSSDGVTFNGDSKNNTQTKLQAENNGDE